MSLDETREFGVMIGQMGSNQDDLQQNLTANDPLASFQLVADDIVTVGGYLAVTAKYLSTTSFVIDHPVYGELDSSVLAIDGTYSGFQPGGIVLPMVFPASFLQGSAGDKQLFYKEF